MSEPKFSPGPWEAHTSYDELWGDDVWYQTEYHSVMANGDTIASDVSSKENATLIAESPNMYKMLDDELQFLLRVSQGFKEGKILTVSTVEERADEIKQLLAKARGEK